MSKRKQKNRRIQPILNALQQTLQLSYKETQCQEQINRAIIEQLLQTDVISQIKSTQSLKLIIYELILICYQQSNKNIECNNENGPVHSRMKNILWAIKDVLSEWNLQSEQNTCKLSDRKTQRHIFTGEMSVKNKMRLFLSYMNQYNNLVDQMQKKSKEIPIKKQDTKEQALINQLQKLVFKKDEQLKLAREDISHLNQKIMYYEQKIVALEQDIVIMKNQNTELIKQNQFMQQEIKLFINKELQKENDIILEQTKTQEKQEKYIWEQSFYSTLQENNLSQQNQLYKIVMSQALTIEALIT